MLACGQEEGREEDIECDRSCSALALPSSLGAIPPSVPCVLSLREPCVGRCKQLIDGNYFEFKGKNFHAQCYTCEGEAPSPPDFPPSLPPAHGAMGPLPLGPFTLWASSVGGVPRGPRQL
jgi:hypothetical protein